MKIGICVSVKAQTAIMEIRIALELKKESFNIYSISSGGVFTKVSSLAAFSSNVPFPGSTNGVSFFP